MYFGTYDFYLEDGCFKKYSSNYGLGHSYQLGEVTGNWAGLNRTHLAGAKEFSVKEIEVYRVIFS